MSHSDRWPLAVFDWGTSNLRAYVVNEAGIILKTINRDVGAKRIAQDRFAPIYNEVMTDSIAEHPCRAALLIGMVGSSIGWVDAPMNSAPQSLPSLAGNLIPIPGTEASIVRGVTARSVAGIPDMMRGEETQVMGALALAGAESSLFCLPGTHSKWVTCEAGAITGITTVMTGEFYELLSEQSVLADQIRGAPGTAHSAGFSEGIDAARSGLGAQILAFSTRPRALVAGKHDPGEAASYLSGLLIGAELLSMKSHLPDATLTLVGSSDLCLTYARAGEALGIHCKHIDGAVAVTKGAALIWAAAHAARPALSHN